MTPTPTLESQRLAELRSFKDAYAAMMQPYAGEDDEDGEEPRRMVQRG